MRSFREVFGALPSVQARAPGRVNLLGEHTDYNDGYVLPTPIPQFTAVEMAVSPDDRFRFYSAELDSSVEYPDGGAPAEEYAQYVYGCIQVLRERSHAVPPVCIHVHSNVPMGAGLSSSAALEVAVLRGLRSLLGLKLDDVDIALLGQEAEIRFAHVRCGIMDQMASSLGDPHHMLFLDTRTLERRLLPLPRNAEIIVIDSGVPRTLAGSGYNERRQQCEAAARMLGVAALRDVTDPDVADTLPPPLDRRARHVISENNRVLEAASGVDARRFGALMNASHASLRDDYEVSVPPLDRLVDLLQRQPAVYGARLTGAGFGGACVALCESGASMPVKTAVLTAYEQNGFNGTALV